MTKWNLKDIKAKARERRAEALALHRGGMSYRALAELWDISITRAGAIIAAARRDEKRGD